MPKYYSNAAKNVLSTGTIWNIAGPRIYHNLAMLVHSIDYMNRLFERFIQKPTTEISIEELDPFFKKLKLDNDNYFHRLTFYYWYNVHYKLWFILLDLILSTDEGIIENLEYIRI